MPPGYSRPPDPNVEVSAREYRRPVSRLGVSGVGDSNHGHGTFRRPASYVAYDANGVHGALGPPLHEWWRPHVSPFTGGQIEDCGRRHAARRYSPLGGEYGGSALEPPWQFRVYNPYRNPPIWSDRTFPARHTGSNNPRDTRLEDLNVRDRTGEHLRYGDGVGFQVLGLPISPDPGAALNTGNVSRPTGDHVAPEVITSSSFIGSNFRPSGSHFPAERVGRPTGDDLPLGRNPSNPYTGNLIDMATLDAINAQGNASPPAEDDAIDRGVATNARGRLDEIMARLRNRTPSETLNPQATVNQPPGKLSSSTEGADLDPPRLGSATEVQKRVNEIMERIRNALPPDPVRDVELRGTHHSQVYAESVALAPALRAPSNTRTDFYPLVNDGRFRTSSQSVNLKNAQRPPPLDARVPCANQSAFGTSSGRNPIDPLSANRVYTTTPGVLVNPESLLSGYNAGQFRPDLPKSPVLGLNDTHPNAPIRGCIFARTQEQRLGPEVRIPLAPDHNRVDRYSFQSHHDDRKMVEEVMHNLKYEEYQMRAERLAAIHQANESAVNPQNSHKMPDMYDRQNPLHPENQKFRDKINRWIEGMKENPPADDPPAAISTDGSLADDTEDEDPPPIRVSLYAKKLAKHLMYKGYGPEMGENKGKPKNLLGFLECNLPDSVGVGDLSLREMHEASILADSLRKATGKPLPIYPNLPSGLPPPMRPVWYRFSRLNRQDPNPTLAVRSSRVAENMCGDCGNGKREDPLNDHRKDENTDTANVVQRTQEDLDAEVVENLKRLEQKLRPGIEKQREQFKKQLEQHQHSGTFGLPQNQATQKVQNTDITPHKQNNDAGPRGLMPASDAPRRNEPKSVPPWMPGAWDNKSHVGLPNRNSNLPQDLTGSPPEKKKQKNPVREDAIDSQGGFLNWKNFPNLPNSSPPPSSQQAPMPATNSLSRLMHNVPENRNRPAHMPPPPVPQTTTNPAAACWQNAAQMSRAQLHEARKHAPQQQTDTKRRGLETIMENKGPNGKGRGKGSLKRKNRIPSPFQTEHVNSITTEQEGENGSPIGRFSLRRKPTFKGLKALIGGKKVEEKDVEQGAN